MTKRKTRSMDMEKDDTDECIIDLPKKKRCRGKNTGVNKRLFEEQCAENTSDCAPAYATLTPVQLDFNEGANDQENSPPPLVIDASKDTCSSQSVLSDYFPRREPIGERLPCVTTNTTNKTNYPSNNYSTNNVIHTTDNANCSNNINLTNKERRIEKDFTPMVDRSIRIQQASNICAQSSSSQIVVSVDRRQRNLNENLNCNRRTSTPLRPSTQHQLSTNLDDDHNDLYSINSIPRDTYDMLSRFPEFRRLVKGFNDEKRKCSTWSRDFARLQQNYNQLEQNSFPRPSAVALRYLVDLVTQIQQSGGRGDPRTDEQLARDLGVSSIFLLGLKDVNPQRTALNLFNHLYSGYEVKAKLGSANNLEIKKSGLLETMLAFAQRSSPGAVYKMQDMKDAINNSIRSARFYWRRLRSSVPMAVNLLNGENDEQMENQGERSAENYSGGRNDGQASDDNGRADEAEVRQRFDFGD